MSTFDLLALEVRANIARLQALSGTPELIVHRQIVGGVSQSVRYHLGETNGQPDVTASTAEIAGVATIHGLRQIGSLTKIPVALVWARIFEESEYEHLGISWDTRANDVFYMHRLPPDTADETVERFCRMPKEIPELPLHYNPTMRQLLTHENSFLDISRFHINPVDGGSLLSTWEFLRVASDETVPDNIDRPWYRYSNANYGFAGILLQMVLRESIGDIVKRLVFDPLGMYNSYTGSRIPADAAARLVQGYRIDSNLRRHLVNSPLYADVVEASSFGALSNPDDMFRLFRHLLAASRDESASFITSDMISSLLGKENLEILDKGHQRCVLGSMFVLNSGVAVPGSLNEHLVPPNSSQKNKPFHAEGKKQIIACRMSGNLNNHSAVVYYICGREEIVAVFTNSSGPFDITDHVAHYVMQQSFDLTPRMNFDTIQPDVALACQALEEIETRNSIAAGPSNNVSDLVGCYEYRNGQRIRVFLDGTACFSHGETRSPALAVIRNGDSNQVSFNTSGAQPHIETFKIWDLRFSIERQGSRVSLVDTAGRRYERIATDPEVAPANTS